MSRQFLFFYQHKAATLDYHLDKVGQYQKKGEGLLREILGGDNVVPHRPMF